MADWVEQINDYIREKGNGDARDALKTALVYINAQHIVMNDNVLEIQRLQKKILGVEFPNVMQSVNGPWGAEIEYNYICPFCGAKAHTLENLRYCHSTDCIWDELQSIGDE